MDITDKTKISFFAVLCSVPILVGGILWLANIDAKATAASIEAKSMREMVLDIHDRIIRIEEHLKVMREHAKDI